MLTLLTPSTATFHCNTVSRLANMKRPVAILILIIFSSWVPNLLALECTSTISHGSIIIYNGYDTYFECMWMEAVDLLVPAAWIAAVGIFLLALTVSVDFSIDYGFIHSGEFFSKP